VELPLGAKPYLCVSHEIDVTPLRRKSKSVVSKPALSRKGTRKEPRQQSTWRGSFFFRARRESEVMSSMMPWGKLGAEPTRRIVLPLMRRATEGMSTW
jgi:hypothetical protein